MTSYLRFLTSENFTGSLEHLKHQVYEQPLDQFAISPKLPLANWAFTMFAVIAYSMTVSSLQQWMRNREPFKLKYFTIFHNLFLSALSLAMSVGMIHGVYTKVQEVGIQFLFCDHTLATQTGTHNFWYYVFFLSKFYEFIDTFLLCLKKKEVIFLHWYHHIITACLVMEMNDTGVAVTWAASIANTVVHVVMYFYYALTAMGHKPWWKKYLTGLQITQFVFDVATNLSGFVYFFYMNQECSGPMGSWIFGQLVLVSFLVLFIQLYGKKYTSADNKKGEAADPKKKAVKQE